MTTLLGVRGIGGLPNSDRIAFVNAANWIGINPDWLATVMTFETGGTFSPTIRNAAGSGAIGLIQFMPSTAQRLLKTATKDEAVNRFKAMTFSQQLEMVKAYFAPYRGKLKSLEDTYLAVIYPAFIGKPLDTILGHAGSPVYDQNAGFDKTGKGYITKSDITSTIRSVYTGAQKNPRVAVQAAGSLIAVAILVIGGYQIVKRIL